MRRLFSLLGILCLYGLVYAQDIRPSSYQELQYRCIGPFRAGRTVGAVGIPDQPNVFYVGVNNGGVWKTEDYGRTWKPLFDNMPTGSIGDIAVAASDPKTMYVATGEGLHRPDLSVGNGMYRSTDGGETWAHVGLDDVQQIARVVVSPADPDLVYVAGLGHPYGANTMRGVFRSRDGGSTWEKVLYINNHTGAMQVEIDPNNPQVLYADLWEHQEGPWENGSFSGPNSGLYKSEDGGTTWRKLTTGLPGADQGLGRIGIDIARCGQLRQNQKCGRMYAVVEARGGNGGVYRSDDAGESWQKISDDHRLFGRGSDFGEIRVHPQDPDIVYVANVASYRSTDGGATWTSFKGAPGGDDYHRIWINPIQPQIMLFAADQGAVVTVNGGQTWGSWYNQPTAQLYHISTDNQYPYWVYGGQQESGAIGTASRGPGGQISFRDWMAVGADEYAYVAADPNNPDIVYGGRVTKFNKKTGQTQYVGPETLRSGDVRYLRTLPLLFHPANNRMLLFATNVLWKTYDGGQHWAKISSDLTRKQPEVPASIGDFTTEEMEHMARRAVIYALGPSPLDSNMIWVGTDDGLVHLTRDGGKTWKDVTPAALQSWDKISQIDAGHFDRGVAYISVNAFRKDDLRPHIFRTRDFGATWQEVVKGMENGGPVNAVREDIKSPGLLFAGTETQVYFSVNDGESWHSLRQNMPATSIRDLVVHEDDLVIGTHGRSIWILDNISPLRELSNAIASTGAYLFQPALATRVRDNMFGDTPLPPEEPTGQNPPDGATLDYFLPKSGTRTAVEILDQQGNLVRRYSSDDMPETIDTTGLSHPTYWIRPFDPIQTSAGHHRMVWDLHYTAPQGTDRSFSIAATYRNTPSEPMGPFVGPGEYKVRLIADGVVSEKTISVRIDPRVTTSAKDIQRQTDLSLECYRNYNTLQKMREHLDALLTDEHKSWPDGEKETLRALRGNGNPGADDVIYGSISEVPLERESVVGLQNKFLFLLTALQTADAGPTSQTEGAMIKLNKRLEELTARMPK